MSARPRRATRGSLLDTVQDLLERTYAHETNGLRAADFVIGDAGLRELYRDRRVVDAPADRDAGPMLLVRQDQPHRALVRLYYPDELVANLEQNDPRSGLTADNITDLAAFVEELDHLLLLAAAWRRGRPVRGVELELHANVSKVLCCSLFLARTLGVPRLDPARREALRHRLFGGGDYGTEAPHLRERYRVARHHALRFLRRLEDEALPRRSALLRTWSLAPLPEKLRLAA